MIERGYGVRQMISRSLYFQSVLLSNGSVCQELGIRRGSKVNMVPMAVFLSYVLTKKATFLDSNTQVKLLSQVERKASYLRLFQSVFNGHSCFPLLRERIPHTIPCSNEIDMSINVVDVRILDYVSAC